MAGLEVEVEVEPSDELGCWTGSAVEAETGVSGLVLTSSG